MGYRYCKLSRNDEGGAMKAIEPMRAVFLAMLVVFLAMIVSAPRYALAQEYPSRPIRLVIPWPPGGITDVIARSLGSVLTESLGQQVVPDNRPGAAGTVGVSIAAKAPADGYT